MGLQGAMNSAVSGLSAQGNAMSVIGNNISNSNTTAYKANRALFSDVLAQEVSSAGGNSQVGRGVNTATVDSDFSQGTFKGTSSNTDLAVDGPGLFIMGQQGSDTVNYTRDGAFNFNDQGYLVNPTGQMVQGYQVNENGDTIGDLTDVQVNTNSSIPAQQTTGVTTVTNLNADTKTNTAGSFGGTYKGWERINATNYDTISFDLNFAGRSVTGGSGISVDMEQVNTNQGGTTTTDTANGLATQLNSLTGSTPAGINSIAGDVTSGGLVVEDSEGNELTITQNGDSFDFSTTNGSNFGVKEFDETVTGSTNTYAQLNVSSDSLGTQTALNSDSTSSVYAFNEDNPAKTSDFSTSVTAYDSLGEAHTITTYFQKTSNNNWDFYFMAPAGEVSGTPDSGQQRVGSGSVEFTPSGEIAATDSASTDPITWNNGSETGQQITYDLSGLTQFSGQSEVVRQEQDGNASGSMVDVNVDQQGNVIANYSNGESQKEFRLGLAQFSNEGGLSRAGNNLYEATAQSGDPAIGVPGSSVGTIRSNSLEQSNVDIAKQFTDMITTQRAYQANSRVISTTKDMLQEVINLTR